MNSSTSNLKIRPHRLTTCIRIPLDMEFFLWYMVYHIREIFNINLPTAHYGTNHVDRDTKIETVENKTKPLITAKGSSYAIMDLLITHSFQLYVPLLVILQLSRG